jgi:hypothetical protein
MLRDLLWTVAESQGAVMADKKIERREVAADLIEATPGRNGLGSWILASPFILFVGWLWLDFFAYLSGLPPLISALFAFAIFLFLIVLPFGLVAHRIITSFPRLFQNAGWDVQALEPVSAAEQYLVRYVPQTRHRAANSWRRRWLRAAQGWVYLEILAIFVGAIVMIPLFFSASEFGFGR